jgi:hypothetical protein
MERKQKGRTREKNNAIDQKMLPHVFDGELSFKEWKEPVKKYRERECVQQGHKFIAEVSRVLDALFNNELIEIKLS